MIEIDGSYGEGGGQILRMAVALSALTSRDVRITNIRAGRPKPGLKRQHMTAIEAVREICGGRVEGLKEGSMEVEFFPGKIEEGLHHFDIGTAGSITLVLQSCILPSVFAERDTRISVSGGTDVRWSPPWDYFRNVFLPLLDRMGISIDGKLVRRGYYPRGGGAVEVVIHPCGEIIPIGFGTGNEKEFDVRGVVNFSSLPEHVAERVRSAAEKELRGKGIEAKIDVKREVASSPGVGIVLWAKDRHGRMLGADSLGERGKPAEKVGREAAVSLLEEIESGTDIDIRAVDQILPYAALANGTSSFRCRGISNHAETEMWLLEKFLDVKFEKRVVGKAVEVTVSPFKGT